MMNNYISNSPSDTKNLAVAVAKLLRGGEIIFLSGPIGAGKTVFVKALAKEMGLKGSPVSATFSIIKEYKSKTKKLFHVDLFRLEEREMFNLGFEEMLADENAVIAAEWPAPLENLINSPRLEMDFILQGGDKREIVLKARGESAEKLLKNLTEALNG
ncbi:MAG: tRNA (adenosine(37)-N6)-threonylcarbamoyltransferase complex ATPase subunit type 1 TsaE [Elusimicrobia bacterium]|nr:tRNA (adenosine(37)-N6)-threonylcarbamoyltransferase complex ATPase subunit type 1 TsaE [Elusimicrobiota bacterium]